MLKADLHLHTHYSPDSATSFKILFERCQQRGINCIAITDHNTIAGALAAREIAPFKVIVGEEIKSTAGEIIGYFLSEEIPKGLSPRETMERIKAQGGLVCIPHPFDSLRRSPLRRWALEELVGMIDLIEVLNSRIILRRDVVLANKFADKHGLPKTAGSDAHQVNEIGAAYIEVPDFEGANDFKQALAQGKIGGHLSSPLVHVATTWGRLFNKFGSRK